MTTRHDELDGLLGSDNAASFAEACADLEAIVEEGGGRICLPSGTRFDGL